MMNLTKAMTIGRKRRRQGQLWPMPVRESDLGHIHAEMSVRPANLKKLWSGRALVDTGAWDTFLPANALRSLGIKPVGTRWYELADGTWHELPIAFAAMEILGQLAGATVVFAGDEEEPLLGVTVLESAGFWIDPLRQRLIPRPPRR